MKTKNFKKFLTIAVSVLYALVGLITGGLFFGAQNASAATKVLDAIKGYGEIASNKYSYIYFGEYPQRRVLEVTNGKTTDANGNPTDKTGWETFPNYCPDSEYVENTIKGYIAELNEQYYNKYLLSLPTTDATRVAVEAHLQEVKDKNIATITLGTYDWETSTIYTFYPQQNYQTKNLYYDATSGYYTLKTNVVYPNSATNKTPGAIAYSAGTKFHTYNHAVDSLSKVYTRTQNGTTSYIYPKSSSSTTTYWEDTTLVTKNSGLTARSNTNNWNVDLDGDGTVETSFNTTKSGETYLYVVEPIKWRVLTVDGDKALLLSEYNLESMIYTVGNCNSINEWAFSNIRSYLNGEYAQVAINGNSANVMNPSTKNFMNKAFNADEQEAIIATEITQDNEQSYYAGAWHYYTENAATTAGKTAADVETPITTTDKVFLLSYTEANGQYGFTSNASRISYNTDYAVATGNYDSLLAGMKSTSTNYSQNTNSGNGGYWWLRSANSANSDYARNVSSSGSIGSHGVYNSLGARPCLWLNLSSLNLASIINAGDKGWLETDSPTPNLTVSEGEGKFGSAQNPIPLNYSAQVDYREAEGKSLKVNTSAAYSMGESAYASMPDELVAGTDAESIALNRGGSWQVESIEKIASGTYQNKYRHVIKVDYNDQVAGSYLVARVVNATSGTNLAMAPITTTLVNSSTPDNNTSTYFVSGTTYFKIITDTAVADYNVIVYSSLNGELQSAGIYPHIDGNVNSGELAGLLQLYTSSSTPLEGYQTGAFDYVYFGEYPNDSVARKITSASATDGYNGATTYGTFTTDSVNITNTILRLIDALNDAYYNTYLKAQTEGAIYKNLVAEKGAYPFATTAYNWLSSTANSQGIYKNDSALTVEYFYPLEDYEDSALFFDFESGYYTLKQDVTSGGITYLAGQKFHTYNNVVDVYQKYGTYYRNDTGVLQTSYGRLLTNPVTGGYNSLSNTGNWNANFGDGQGSVTYNWANAGSTYLFEVEPIKWRVLAINGNNITVMTDDLIDSVKFQHSTSFGNEWQYSLARAWLNGIEQNTLTGASYNFTNYGSGRSFIDMALSPALQNAIVEKTHAQYTDRSYYEGKWHYYYQPEKGTAEYELRERYGVSGDASYSGWAKWDFTAPVEPMPITTDKVWFLSEDEATGTNRFAGLTNGASNKAYNSDYSIVTGNYDHALAQATWAHNTRTQKNHSDNYGGLWWLRSANSASSYYARIVNVNGGITYYNVNYSLGARPCLTLNLGSLNLASVTSESWSSEGSTIAGPAEGQGSQGNPISATLGAGGQVGAYGASTNGVGANLKTGHYYIYDVHTNMSGSTMATGHWRVVGVENSASEAGAFTHKIEVKYYGVLPNGYLNALIYNKQGEKIGFATIANGAVGASGTTCFVFDAPTNNTGDYIIEILHGVNGHMTGTDIYELTQDGIYGAAGTLWLDPANGDDRNSGLLEAYPIATIDRAMQIAGKNCVIMLKGTIYITADTVIDFGAEKNVTIKRWYLNRDFYFSGNMFEVGTWDSTLSEEANKANRVNLILNNVTVTGGVHADYRYYYGSLFTINNAKVVVNDGFKAKNSWINFVNRDTDGGVFYVSNSDLTINGGEFSNITLNAPSTRGSSGAAVCATGSSNIVVNGGEFVKCVAYYGGAIFCDNIASLNILGGYFDQNAVTYGCIEVRNTKNVVISNIKVENAQTRNNSTYAYYGAISLRRSGTVSISNCEFVNNIMPSNGGAIGLIENSAATISNCTFIGNKSTGGSGGAIYASASNLTITGSTFEGNTAGQASQYYHGGAICIINGNLNIDDCEFLSNQGVYKSFANGGAIYASLGDCLTSNYTLAIKNSKFAENLNGSGSATGGAVCVSGGKEALFENCDFYNNTSSYSGGAIYSSAHTSKIIGCSFESNQSEVSAGAIYVANNFIFEDCYFANNTTNNTANNAIGGAISNIYRMSSSQTASYFYTNEQRSNAVKNCVQDIRNCIFESNAASYGGAVALSRYKTFNISDSVFAGNTALVGGAVLMASVDNIENSLTLTNCNFENNSASGKIEYAMSETDENVYIASGGGAVAMLGPTLNVDNCNFTGNTATASGSAGNGGAIFTSKTCLSVNVTSSNFVGNSASYNGGAVNCLNDNNTAELRNFEDCYFELNTAGSSGGGINTDGNVIKNAEFYTNCSFVNNSAANYGGAMRVQNSTIDGGYFYRNEAYTGGAIQNAHAMAVKNTVIEYNCARQTGSAFYKSSSVTIQDNVTIKNNFAKTGWAIDGYNSVVFNGENINIYNNYNNLKDGDGNLITDPQNLVLDADGNIVANADAKLANISNETVKYFAYNIYKLLNSKVSFTYKTTEIEDDLAIITGIRLGTFDLSCITLDYAEEMGVELYFKGNPDDPNGYYAVYVKHINQGSVINYVASSYNGVYDNEYHTIDVEVFGLANYKIEYGLTTAYEYGTTAPMFKDATLNGSGAVEAKTVYFKISSSGKTAVEGSRGVRIEKAEATLSSYSGAVGTVWAGQTIYDLTHANAEDDYSYMFTGFEITDNLGNNIPFKVKFGFWGEKKTYTFMPNSLALVNYDFIFEPLNPNYASFKRTIYTHVTYKIEYDNLWYLNGVFYPEDPATTGADGKKLSDSASTYAYKVTDGQNGVDLNTMISFVKAGGTLYLGSTYTIASGKTVNLSIDKELAINRASTREALFNVVQNGVLNLNVANGVKLEVKGGFSGGQNHSLIYNSGKLSIVGNVEFGHNGVKDDTTLTNQGNGSVLYNFATGEAVLDSCKFVHDNANGIILAAKNGGAVYNLGSLIIKNCETVALNTRSLYAMGAGGTIYSAGTLKIYDSKLVSSLRGDSNVGGGVIYVAANSSAEIYNTYISGSALYSEDTMQTTSLGGGLYIGEGATAYLEDCEITGCKAYSGGGIYVAGNSSGVGGSLTLVNTKVDNNSLVDGTSVGHGNGGGIYAGNNTTIIINGGSISGNMAYNYDASNPANSWVINSNGAGGAIRGYHATRIEIFGGTIIRDNKARLGGALALNACESVKLSNCVLSNNAARYYIHSSSSSVLEQGGEIYSLSSSIEFNYNCEIFNNSEICQNLIYLNKSTLNINNLIITSNVVNTDIIKVDESTLNIYNCQIKGNICTYVVNLYYATINMYGGLISGNQVSSRVAYLRFSTFNMYGGEISYNDNLGNTSAQGAITLGTTSHILLDGGNILYNNASGTSGSGSNIRVAYTDSTLTIKSGRVLSAHKDPSKNAYGRDIYIAGGLEDIYYKHQLELYGGEVDSIYIANQIGWIYIKGKVVVNDGIYADWWNLTVDSTTTRLCPVGEILPGSKIVIRALSEDKAFLYFLREKYKGIFDINLIESQLQYFEVYKDNVAKKIVENALTTDYIIYVFEGNITGKNLYFKPVSGDDSKVGTDSANAVKTWGEIVSLAKETGISTVYLLETWALSNGDNFDGNGLTLVRDSSLTTSMITLASGATATLKNFVIDGNGVDATASAIDNNGTLTIDNCIIKNCKNASGYGGAICNLGTLTVKNSTLEANSANYGGAIYSGGGSTLTVDNCMFDFNDAKNNGGAICLWVFNKDTNGYLDCFGTITNSVFNNNRVSGGTNTYMRGGAIYSGGDTPASGVKVPTLTISGCEFINNSATTTDKTKTNYEGGAIYALTGYLTVANSKFANNTALGSGGAIRSNITQTTIDVCEFVNNKCDSTASAYGGAIDHVDSSNIYGFEVKNSNFVGNYASIDGTALRVNSIGKILIDNCQFDASFNAGGSVLYINSNAVNANINDQVPPGTEPYYDVEVTNSTFENSKSSYVITVMGKSQRTKLENLTFANNEGASEVIRNIAISNSTSKFLYRNIKFENNKNGKIFHNTTGTQATAEEHVFDGITVDYFSGSIMFDLYPSANVTFKLNNVNAKVASGNGISLSNSSVTSIQNNLNIYISNSMFDGLNKNTSNLINITVANNVEINNCYIQNKASSGNHGIHISKCGKLTMNNCYVRNCISSSYAGAAYIVSPATLNNCYFENNTAGADGGAIYFNSGAATLNGCYFVGNGANGGSGGAIMSTQVLNLNYCHFENNNSTGTGGAVKANTIMNAKDCYFINNSSSHSNGGGAVDSYSSGTFNNCYFEGNTALKTTSSSGAGGGAIRADILYLYDCIFSGNDSNYRGGAIILKTSTAKTIIENCTFKNNGSTTIYTATASLKIDNCEFNRNKSTAIQIAGSGSLNVINSYFTENSGTQVVGSTVKTAILENNKIVANTCTNLLSGDFIIDNCQIVNNVISGANGIIILGENNTIYNTNFVGNVAVGSANGAGRMFDIRAGKRATFENCNFYDNVCKPTNSNTVMLFFVYGGELILDGCRLSNNTVRTAVDNPTLIQNSVYVAAGGYVYMRDTVISNKNSTGYNASGNGVVYIGADAVPCVMVGCEIENGDYGTGSAIVNRGTLSMVDTYAHGNVADNGAVVKNYGILNISGENTRFVCNAATNKGGAILNNAGGRLTINIGEQAGVFEGNRANCGGAIYNAEGAYLVVSNGTFRANEAVASADGSMFGNGAGIYNLGNLTINDGLFEGNTAQNGGGVYNLGNMTVNNGIFKKNYITIGGGGIYNATETLDGTTYVGNLVINYAEFTQNTPVFVSSEVNDATDSPKTYGYGIANGGNLTVRDGYFYQNQRSVSVNQNTNGLGGAIYVLGGGVTNIFGGKFVNNKAKGASIYATENSIVNVSNASFEAPYSFADIYIYNATANILNCKITTYSKTENYSSLIYCYGSLNNVVIKGCEFYDMYVRIGAVNLYNTDNIVVENCYFYNNTIHSGSRLISIDNSKFTNRGIIIKGCVFENNTSTAQGSNIIRVYNTSGVGNIRVVIQDCLFKDNVIKGQIDSSSTEICCIIQVSWARSALINNKFVNNETLNSSIIFLSWIAVETPIVDCEYRGNISNRIIDIRGGNGNNYYGIELYGNNTITNNKVRNSAVYFEGALVYRTQVGFGGKLVVEDNFLCDADGNYLDVSGNITTDPSKYVQSNIEIPSSADKKLGLFGGLAEGSRVGIHINLASGTSLYNGYVVGSAVDANYPITTGDVEKLFYDNNEYGLALRGGNVVLVSPSDVSGDRIFVSDKVYLVDGEFKGFENSDFEVYKNGVQVNDFKVLYADDEAAFNAGDFSETSPKFASLGEYTVWYKIVDSAGADLTKADGSTYSGTATIKFVKHVLTLVEAPIARISKGEALSNATIVGGKVMSNGHAVAGTWAFEAADTVPTDNTTKYVLKFVASAENIYANTVSTSVAVEWLFENVVYKAVSGVNDGKAGFFVGDKWTGISLLSEIMPLMANNSTITINTTYIFNQDEVVTANNTVTIYPHEGNLNSNQMFLIDEESEISVMFGGGIGKIIIDGKAEDHSHIVLFKNNYKLTLGSNVLITRWKKLGKNTLIQNSGDLIVNASFSSNSVASLTEDGLGGLIYSTGSVVINGGNFVNNTLTWSDSSIKLYGGVVYNNGGSVVISGGTFSNNTVSSSASGGYGGVIYNNGGNVDVNGGVFNKNSAQYGGVIYNKGGKVVFGGGTMLFNTASASGAVVYNDESDADQANWGEIVYNGSEMLANSILGNGQFDSQVAVSGVNLQAIFAVVLAVLAVGVLSGILLHKHLKGKRK